MKWLTRCHDLRFLNVELKANFFMKLVTSHIQYSPLPFWRRQWQPTPVLLPGKSHGQRSLVYCNPWGREESDTTERLHFHFSLSCIREGNGNPLQYSCLENPRDRGAWLAAVYGVSQSQTRLSEFLFTFHFHALEKEMATHSSVLAWRIPGMAEPGGLPSMGSHRVGHDWSDLAVATSADLKIGANARLYRCVQCNHMSL